MTNYKTTLKACFTGYIVQAIINNFVPLLFVTLHGEYGISLSKISLLITINFGLQLAVDLLAALFIDKTGYRIPVFAAHILAAAGLILLTVLPDLFSNAFVGILIAVSVYAVGGGLLEVLISPIVEACPTPNKEKAMSLLHSFYCWGHVVVVLLSTIFFKAAGISNWRIMALIWAVVPVVNAFIFLKVPLVTLNADGRAKMPIKSLFKSKIFWILMLIMICAGASEQAVSQWASAFAQSALSVDKTIGDLAGPMMFAVMMGASRAFFGKFGDRLNLDRFMKISTVLCIASYLVISLSPSAVASLIGCALCGLSVGIMWPGTFSKSSVALNGATTSLFALLALAGDVGCALGPATVGWFSETMDNDLKKGILLAVVFPMLLIAALYLLNVLIKSKQKNANAQQ